MSPRVLSFRVDSETASTSSRSHPRNMFTSCGRASRRRSCSTAWSRSESPSPATPSGEPLHSFSPSDGRSRQLLDQTAPSPLSKKAFSKHRRGPTFLLFVRRAITRCPLSFPVIGINMIPLPHSSDGKYSLDAAEIHLHRCEISLQISDICICKFMINVIFLHCVRKYQGHLINSQNVRRTKIQSTFFNALKTSALWYSFILQKEDSAHPLTKAN